MEGEKEVEILYTISVKLKACFFFSLENITVLQVSPLRDVFTNSFLSLHKSKVAPIAHK